MKTANALIAVGLLSLPGLAQGEDTRVARLEAQLARYRAATDKLVETLTRTNAELNERVKELSKAQGDLTIKVARLQVELDRKPTPEPDSGDRQRGVRRFRPPVPKIGLIYRAEYQAAVDSLALAAEAMKQADSVTEGLKLLDAAAKDIEAARKALDAKQ